MADPHAPQRALFEAWARTRAFDLTMRVPGYVQMNYRDQRTRDAWAGWLHAGGSQAPIDMVLHCPKCHTQHIDAPESPMRTGALESLAGLPAGSLWTNRPHRSHLCHQCGTIWRPADVCTNGVASIATRGKSDTWSPA